MVLSSQSPDYARWEAFVSEGESVGEITISVGPYQKNHFKAAKNILFTRTFTWTSYASLSLDRHSVIYVLSLLISLPTLRSLVTYSTV